MSVSIEWLSLMLTAIPMADHWAMVKNLAGRRTSLLLH